MSGRFVLRRVRELQLYYRCSAKKYAARPWTPHVRSWSKTRAFLGRSAAHRTEILFTEPISDNEVEVQSCTPTVELRIRSSYF
jgi:hypothetical protein